jgi:hypothetical protein
VPPLSRSNTLRVRVQPSRFFGYATQREYDSSSGFKPIRPEEYSNWYRDVAANIAATLAPDGSYFLNIKEHTEGGHAAYM